MRRQEREPLSKHCVNLFKGDFESLQELHGQIGAGKAIREIVRGHIARAKEAAAQKVQTNIDIGKVEI